MNEVRYISADWVAIDPDPNDRLIEAFGGRSVIRQEGTALDPPPAALLTPGDPVVLPGGMSISVRPIAPWHSAGVALSPVLRLKTDFAGPALDLFPITPDDDTDLPVAADALYIGGHGVMSVVTARGEMRTFPVDDFCIIPVSVRRVRATGTTATDIYGLV